MAKKIGPTSGKATLPASPKLAAMPVPKGAAAIKPGRVAKPLNRKPGMGRGRA